MLVPAEGEGRPNYELPYELPKEPWEQLKVLIGIEARNYAKETGVDFTGVKPPENMLDVQLPTAEQLEHANLGDLLKNDTLTQKISDTLNPFLNSGQEVEGQAVDQDRAVKMAMARYEYRERIEKAARKETSALPNSPTPEVKEQAKQRVVVSSECVICHFEAQLDDMVTICARGCICLGCYERQTGTKKRMPEKLENEIRSVVSNPNIN